MSNEKYLINGYAPGNYNCRCHKCGVLFMGDKRSVTCNVCATESVENQLPPELGKKMRVAVDSFANYDQLAEQCAQIAVDYAEEKFDYLLNFFEGVYHQTEFGKGENISKEIRGVMHQFENSMQNPKESVDEHRETTRRTVGGVERE